MKQSLTQAALKLVPSPQILVNIVSKRVRQLGQGHRPLVVVDPKLTFMDIALKEIGEGKLSFELLEAAPVVAPLKKSRRAAISL